MTCQKSIEFKIEEHNKKTRMLVFVSKVLGVKPRNAAYIYSVHALASTIFSQKIDAYVHAKTEGMCLVLPEDAHE